MSDLVEAIRVAEDWAGTMPAKEAVKVRPSDWHAITDLGRKAAARIEQLNQEVSDKCDSINAWRAKATALEAEVQRLRYHRKRLDARIHNQRKALRVNWQIAEERAGYRPSQSKEVRSRLLAIACRSDAKARALEAEVQRLREALCQARDWFQQYADGHAAKGDTDKAKRNQDRADFCARAAMEPTND